MPEFLLCCIVCLHSLCWVLCCHGHIVSGTWLSYLKAVSSMSMLHCTSVLVVDIISEWKHLCHPLPIKCFLNHYTLAWIIRLIWRNNENKSPKICVLPIFWCFFPLFYILLAKWILPYTIFFFLNVCLWYSVSHSFGFLLSFLYYFIFPPWYHFPYNLHAATCPALSRTCSQPTIQQTRAGPSCSHTPVETGKETAYEYNSLLAPNTSYHYPVFKPILFQHLVQDCYFK